MKWLSLAAAASMLGLALVMPPMTDLHAAELRILAGGSMTGPLNELGPQFERATGHKLVIHFDSTPNLIKLRWHKSNHPDEYHAWVWTRLRAALDSAPGPNKQAVFSAELRVLEADLRHDEATARKRFGYRALPFRRLFIAGRQILRVF